MDKSIFDAESDNRRNSSLQHTDLKDRIRQLLNDQPFCILCTQGKRQPYGSLIAFAFTEDLKHIYFTTSTNTWKFKLLSQCKQAAVVVDSRCQHQSDLIQIEAITIMAKTRRVPSGEENKKGIHMLKLRHPYLSDFLKSESTALFRADPMRYIHVTRFQEVSEWIPSI